MVGFSETPVPTGALYGAGWPAFGIAAALVLDGASQPRLGRVLSALALLPTAMVVVALPTGNEPLWSRVELVWRAADVGVVLLTLAALAWAVGYAPGRLPRRRLFWLLVASGATFGAVALADALLEPRAEAVVITLGTWALAGIVARLATAVELRPVDEPLWDAAAVAMTVAVGAVAGAAVRLVGTRAGIPGPDEAAAFAAVASTALAWPAAGWWRRSRVIRRYGTGTLTPGQVSSITADLHRLVDPRQLLARAADMVCASTGHRGVLLVLGVDDPDVSTGWVAQPLLVGGERVGTLLVEPSDPEGPEPRQARMVAQLQPTLALVCKAVALAVEAEHARRDVARERDAERARILRDLHDGLGPVLAGMSMRVQAELRSSPNPFLQELAPGLAEARGDLRRIVAGLEPSALHDAGLAGALQRLAGTFDGDGRTVGLELAVEGDLPGDVVVAAYRCVAEGLTNAVRHGSARHVMVRVGTAHPGRVTVEVQDDGVGGPIAPGVGLTSLRQRAEQLGGSLSIGPCATGGMLLRVELPTADAP